MLWQDIVVDRTLSRTELTEALCSVFGVTANEIMITKNMEGAKVDSIIRILCQTFIVKAPFPLLVSIYLRDDSLIPADDTLAVGQLCELLNCRVLMSDESVNPFSMLLVKGVSDVEQIFINVDEYDNAEEYELQ